MYKTILTATFATFLLSPTADAAEDCGSSTGGLEIEDLSGVLDSESTTAESAPQVYVTAKPKPHRHSHRRSGRRYDKPGVVDNIVRAVDRLTTQPRVSGTSGGRVSTYNTQQIQTRSASADWKRLRDLRSLLNRASSAARFSGGPDGFLAAVTRELSRSSLKDDFMSAYNRADRGITLRFTYDGNPVSVYIPGTDLDRAVDTLADAANGRLGDYQYNAPPRVTSAGNTPLDMRLFAPQTTASSVLYWSALTVAHATNPNHRLSTRSGWHARHHRRH